MALKSWSTIHIFGYGESQIIGKGDDDKPFSRKKKTDELTSAQEVIDFAYGKKPADNQAPKDYFKIDIFNGGDTRFSPKGNLHKSWSFKTHEIPAEIIQALIDELVA